MKFCFDLGGKTYCIPVPFRRRWPWEEVIFKDRIRDLVDEQPNPWITGDLKAEMVKDAHVLAGIEALVHQLVQRLSKNVALPYLRRVLLKFLQKVVHQLLALPLAAHNGRHLGGDIRLHHMDGRR